MNYQLLNRFREVFEDGPYRHRRSNLGDSVAIQLYEDLYNLNRSSKFVHRVRSGISVVNAQNRRQGVKARRGDGSFGEIVPQISPMKDQGFNVCRGPIATIEIGIEVKILFKAMIKQIDRVINDLHKQVDHFRSKGGSPVCVGIVGINQASHCISFEGDNAFPTDGRKYKHPIEEADEAESRLRSLAAPAFDEFLILRFKATNEKPYDFSWFNQASIEMDYGASLARVSSEYEKRF